jgi:uncharacterized protein
MGQMTLKEQLQEDLKTALRQKNSLKLNTIRSLKSVIKNKEIEIQKELEDEDVISLIVTQIKKNKEAAELFGQGNRPELQEKELQEVTFLLEYLPKQVSEEELRARIQQIIKETGAEDAKDLGKIMKCAISEFKGKAESAVIKSLALEYLTA